MRQSGLIFPTSRVTDTRDGLSVLEAAGYVRNISPGCFALLPLGVRVLGKITNILRTIAESLGFSEIALPLLQERRLWDESGRSEKYPGLLCETTIGEDGRYVINPTQEEAVLNLFRDTQFRSNDLPLRLFQISERVRNEIRPAHGLIRSRCFTLADFYALSSTEVQMQATVEDLESLFESLEKWTSLPFQRGLYRPSTMGARVYSYWVPSVTKQCEVHFCENCRASFRSREDLKRCPECKNPTIERVLAAEVGDLMTSASLVAQPMRVHAPGSTDPVRVVMAGIGVSRLLQILAEYNRDKNGLVWPMRIAPYAVHVVATPKRMSDVQVVRAALSETHHDSFVDLRECGMGRKLIDADLIGAPIQVVLGTETPSGVLEVRERGRDVRQKLNIEQFISFLSSL